jgi:hypothetical protein
MRGSPIVQWFFKLLFVTVIANRILFTYETYKRISIERTEDRVLKSSFCTQVDRTSIGRHTSICLEADRRLATPNIVHTLKHVVDDTLYREFHFHKIATISVVCIAVLFIGHIHTRYIKSTFDDSIPIYRKPSLKID